VNDVDEAEQLIPPSAFADGAVEAPGAEARRALLRLPRRLLALDALQQVNPVPLLGREEGRARASAEVGQED